MATAPFERRWKWFMHYRSMPRESLCRVMARLATYQRQVAIEDPVAKSDDLCAPSINKVNAEWDDVDVLLDEVTTDWYMFVDTGTFASPQVLNDIHQRLETVRYAINDVSKYIAAKKKQ